MSMNSIDRLIDPKMSNDTEKQIADQTLNTDIDDFLSPKVDVPRSLKNSTIMFMQPLGPREKLNGNILSRSLIGNQSLMDEAIYIKEDRIRKEHD